MQRAQAPESVCPPTASLLPSPHLPLSLHQCVYPSGMDICGGLVLAVGGGVGSGEGEEGRYRGKAALKKKGQLPEYEG